MVSERKRRIGVVLTAVTSFWFVCVIVLDNHVENSDVRLHLKYELIHKLISPKMLYSEYALI